MRRSIARMGCPGGGEAILLLLGLLLAAPAPARGESPPARTTPPEASPSLPQGASAAAESQSTETASSDASTPSPRSNPSQDSAGWKIPDTADADSLASETGGYLPASATPDGESTRRPRARFKSGFWLPLGSIFLPGFGQYFQSDPTGKFYTGAAVAGALVFLSGAAEAYSDAEEGDPKSLFDSESWSYRKVILGSMAMQGSGFLSGYSAFRIAVPRLQEENGKFRFLSRTESAGELMAAPFRFGELAKPSAFIPLGLLAGGVAALVSYERRDHRGADWTLSGDDFLFVGPLAWNAGVTEEAIFRGWIYPQAYQLLGENFWLANGAQALLFGLAHYDPDLNPVPWPQTLLGFYFGWLTWKNGWTLTEAAFVHAWWDMILFAGQVAATYRDQAARASFRLDLPLHIP